jgi:hypothetical protein
MTVEGVLVVSALVLAGGALVFWLALAFYAEKVV